MNFEEFFITRDAVVTIKIPHQFVGELYRDRFRETFERVKADFHCMAGNYEEEILIKERGQNHAGNQPLQAGTAAFSG